MSQQLLKEVDGSFKSFFALLKLVKEKGYPASAVKIPHYLPKDGFATLVVQEFAIHNGIFVLPYSRSYNKGHEKVKIKVPPILEGKKVKEIAMRTIKQGLPSNFENWTVAPFVCSNSGNVTLTVFVGDEQGIHRLLGSPVR